MEKYKLFFNDENLIPSVKTMLEIQLLRANLLMIDHVDLDTACTFLFPNNADVWDEEYQKKMIESVAEDILFLVKEKWELFNEQAEEALANSALANKISL
jgi:hypothetical protein